MRVALAVVLLVALAGCGSDRAAACGADVRERLDPNSARHLLGDARPPPYLTEPPTSGAHRVGRWPTGRLTRPIARPVQVAMLEGGEVLLQHKELSAEARLELEALAGTHVTVAPGTGLRAPVVATAWTHKLTCTRVDVGALRAFVRRHAGVGA